MQKLSMLRKFFACWCLGASDHVAVDQGPHGAYSSLMMVSIMITWRGVRESSSLVVLSIVIKSISIYISQYSFMRKTILVGASYSLLRHRPSLHWYIPLCYLCILYSTDRMVWSNFVRVKLHFFFGYNGVLDTWALEAQAGRFFEPRKWATAKQKPD